MQRKQQGRKRGNKTRQRLKETVKRERAGWQCVGGSLLSSFGEAFCWQQDRHLSSSPSPPISSQSVDLTDTSLNNTSSLVCDYPSHNFPSSSFLLLFISTFRSSLFVSSFPFHFLLCCFTPTILPFNLPLLFPFFVNFFLSHLLFHFSVCPAFIWFKVSFTFHSLLLWLSFRALSSIRSILSHLPYTVRRFLFAVSMWDLGAFTFTAVYFRLFLKALPTILIRIPTSSNTSKVTGSFLQLQHRGHTYTPTCALFCVYSMLSHIHRHNVV